MKNWIKNLFKNKKTIQIDYKSNNLNSRVKKKHKEWHRKLRILLELSPESEKDIDCDFDVLFEFWKIPLKDIKSVFSEINGIEEILNEIITYTKSGIIKKRNFKDYSKLINLNINKTIENLSNYIDVNDLKKMPIKIENGDFYEDYKKFDYLTSLTENYDDNVVDKILKTKGELEYSLALFLTEPLYRISSSYLPVYYFKWKLIGLNDNLNPYKYLFELSRDYNTSVLICENEIKVYANHYFE